MSSSMKSPQQTRECPTAAERRAIKRHHAMLCRERGADVSYDEACDDWFENHAVKWREERQRRMLTLQRSEIERHKWIESEKARRDLGRDAVLDWISRYAANWRDWFESEENLLTS